MNTKLHFLGTGGGRYVTSQQKRKTGGIALETPSKTILIDPGPGALVEWNKNSYLDVLDGVLVSHSHLDHVGDAEAMVEYMAYASNVPGALFASKSAIKGHKEIGQAISDYHQSLVKRKEILGSNTKASLGKIGIESQLMSHSDPTTVGLRLDASDSTVGFWTDSEFKPELAEFYKGVEILVAFTSKPWSSSSNRHLSLSEIPQIEDIADPDTIIVTDFGFEFLEKDLEKQKDKLKAKTNSNICFASDGLIYPGDHSLESF